MTRLAAPAGAGGARAAPPRPGSRIFISYRRRDAKHAARALHERLCEHFGEARVFIDRSDIGGGADFVEVIRRELGASAAVVVVIGEHWLSAAEDGRRRLDDPGDYVRMEVATALARGAFVVPVLVDGAQMPRERDLPDDLKPLARRNAEVLDDRHWDADIERLAAALKAGLEERQIGLARVLRRFWRRKLVRVGVGALALAAALSAQYRFAYRAAPVELAETGLFAPAAARRGRDELVIEGPQTDSAAGLLFSHEGRADEVVDLGFERARVGDQTRALLAALDSDAPQEFAGLALQTLYPPEEGPAGAGPEAGETCRTSVAIRAARPAALRLYQLKDAGGERFRDLELKADGGDLHVRAVTAMPEGGTAETLGCQKSLSAGDSFAETIEGMFTLDLIAEAGSACRISFNAAGRGGPPWGEGRGGLFRPFELGGAPPKPDSPAPLRARAVHVRPLGGGGGPPLLSARAADGGLLNLDGLEVGPDSLLLGVSGRALVESGGAAYADPAARLKQHPAAAALFAVADLALLAWFLLLLFGARRRRA
ncbi:MAG TPA: toll/interleukin-1 receptor domain-containing protein [Pyrinomonadaceae bacterium]|nr:toll/interleukin-1 receptor domain-containing protein [Pyrinomonadaceae bacterium]